MVTFFLSTAEKSRRERNSAVALSLDFFIKENIQAMAKRAPAQLSQRLKELPQRIITELPAIGKRRKIVPIDLSRKHTCANNITNRGRELYIMYTPIPATLGYV